MGKETRLILACFIALLLPRRKSASSFVDGRKKNIACASSLCPNISQYCQTFFLQRTDPDGTFNLTSIANLQQKITFLWHSNDMFRAEFITLASLKVPSGGQQVSPTT